MNRSAHAPLHIHFQVAEFLLQIVCSSMSIRTFDRANETAATTSNGKSKAKRSLSTHSARDILVNTRTCGAQGAVVHAETGKFQDKHAFNNNIGPTNRSKSNMTLSPSSCSYPLTVSTNPAHKPLRKPIHSHKHGIHSKPVCKTTATISIAPSTSRSLHSYVLEVWFSSSISSTYSALPSVSSLSQLLRKLPWCMALYDLTKSPSSLGIAPLSYIFVWTISKTLFVP